MRCGRRAGALAGVAAAAWALAAGGAEGAQELRYVKRLSLPVAGDQIGYGTCVTVDPHAGEVFVCDARTNRILIFDREGRFEDQIVLGRELTAPQDLAVDADGFLLVLAARGGRVVPVELDFDGLFRREIALAGLPADSLPPTLVSIAAAPAGDRLYVLDAANRALWIVDRDGLVLSVIDLAAGLVESVANDLILGHVDVYSDTVLVALPSLGQVLVLSLDGAPRGTVGVKGGARCQLGRPNAAAVARDGNLLVVDRQRMVLTRWSRVGNRCLAEYLGIGDAPGFLYYPYDMALDERGRLYVAQTYQGRVQVYEGLPGAAAAVAREGPAGGAPDAP